MVKHLAAALQDGSALKLYMQRSLVSGGIVAVVGPLCGAHLR